MRSSARWVCCCSACSPCSPGGVGQALAGVPLSAAGCCAGGVVYAALALPQLGWGSARWLAVGLAVVIGLKVLAAATAPPLGLAASYWASATADGPPGALDGLPVARATRRASTPALDLRGDEFPVHFFNDAARFNFGPDVQPGRDQLPFSVRWQGWLLVAIRRRSGVSSSSRRARRRSGSTTSHLPAPETSLPRHGAGCTRCGWSTRGPEARVPLAAAELGADARRAARAAGRRPTCAGSRARPARAEHARWRGRRRGLAALSLAWVALGLELRSGSRRPGARRARRGAAAVPGARHAPARAAGRPRDDPVRARRLADLRELGARHPAQRAADGRRPGPRARRSTASRCTRTCWPWRTGSPAKACSDRWRCSSRRWAWSGRHGACWRAARSARAWTAWSRWRACWLLLQLEAEHFKVARQLFNENLYMPLVMASLIVLVGAGAAARSRRPGGRRC